MYRGIALFMLLMMPMAYAEIDAPKLADAIFLAEGGKSASVPYGIMFKGCDKAHPEYCRKICLNTIRNNIRRWKAQNGKDSPLNANFDGFIKFLGSRYAPIGASNDPNGLNRNWISNVSALYERGA